MDKLVEMLRIQKELQEQTFGFDFPAMSTHEKVRYIKDMYIAAVKELGEALDETTWKPWQDGEDKQINNSALTAELSDAFQFIMNMWFAAQPFADPEQLAAMMLKTLEYKVFINKRRKETGVAEKCPRCKRALDDPAVSCNTVRVDECPKPVCDGWCSAEGKFYYWINTTDHPMTIVPEDQPIGHRDTVTS